VSGCVTAWRVELLMAYPSYVGCDLARSINRIRHPLYCPPYTRTELNSKEHQIDELYSVRIAYQTPIATHLPATGEAIQALPNTFEDSFVLSNAAHFAAKKGRTGLMKSFIRILNEAETAGAIGERFFNELREGKKAEFVLLVLSDENFPTLEIPEYISEGLQWLESKLRSKQKELLVIPPVDAEVTP